MSANPEADRPGSGPGLPGGSPGSPGSQPAPYRAGEVAPVTPRPRPNRSADEIRRDIEEQRQQLGNSVEHLRDRVTELTDWRGQIRKHRRELVVGAAAAGFVLGGLAALRRRR